MVPVALPEPRELPGYVRMTDAEIEKMFNEGMRLITQQFIEGLEMRQYKAFHLGINWHLGIGWIPGPGEPLEPVTPEKQLRDLTEKAIGQGRTQQGIDAMDRVVSAPPSDREVGRRNLTKGVK